MVYLSANPKSYSLQPENAIPVSKWDPTTAGATADSDTALLDLMPLLESIVRKNAPDARAVITSLKEEAAREARASAQHPFYHMQFPRFHLLTVACVAEGLHARARAVRTCTVPCLAYAFRVFYFVRSRKLARC